MMKPVLFRAGVVSDALASKRGKVALLLALVVLTAGCSGVGGDDSATATDPLDSVPANVDVVTQMDVQVDNETTAAIADELNATAFVGGETDGDGAPWTGMVAANGSGLGPNDVDRITAFARLPGSANETAMASSNTSVLGGGELYAGAIVETDASWEQIVQATDGKLDEADERSVGDSTVYVVDGHDAEIWIGDLGGDTFAVGTEAAVRDVIETRAGEADPFSGELRTAFETADEGAMKVAVDLPDGAVQSVEEGSQGEIPVDLDLPEVRVLTFVADTDGANVSMAAQLTTANEGGASELAGLFQLASGVGEQMGEKDLSLLEGLNVEQDGRHVTVRTTLTIAEIADLVEQFEQFGMGDAPVGSNGDTAATDGQPSLGKA